MGYTIRIGEATFSKDTEHAYIGISAKEERHDAAPAFGEPTDFTNERWPSYTVWAEFLRAVGLYELFTEKDRGLMRSHPGVALLTKNHQAKIHDALEEYRKKGTTPGFSETMLGEKIAGAENADPMLARLIWLDYWVTWAVNNCENPVLTNS
jgi:hypothetical protein